MPEKRKSAFLRATQEAQATTVTVAPSQSKTAEPFYSETLKQQERDTAKKTKKKVSFYLDEEHEAILDNLELEYRLQKRKINRNDILRYLIAQYGTMSHLQGL